MLHEFTLHHVSHARTLNENQVRDCVCSHVHHTWQSSQNGALKPSRRAKIYNRESQNNDIVQHHKEYMRTEQKKYMFLCIIAIDLAAHKE